MRDALLLELIGRPISNCRTSILAPIAALQQSLRLIGVYVSLVSCLSSFQRPDCHAIAIFKLGVQKSVITRASEPS